MKSLRYWHFTYTLAISDACETFLSGLTLADVQTFETFEPTEEDNNSKPGSAQGAGRETD